MKTINHQSLLMRVIASKALEKGLSNPETAKSLGIGYIYFMKLLSGERKTESLSRDALVQCARFINVPIAEAYLLAGALLPTDFIIEGEFSKVELSVYETILRHPLWGGFMPIQKQWDVLPESLKLLVTYSFEQSTGIKLIKDEMKTMIPSDSENK